jgi:hypothetical protein
MGGVGSLALGHTRWASCREQGKQPVSKSWTCGRATTAGADVTKIMPQHPVCPQDSTQVYDHGAC